MGKSTLAAELVRDRQALAFTLDDEQTRAAADADPQAFVDQCPSGTLVIDEIQLRPELLRTIKATVDRDRRPGRFLLTGSANLLRLRGETDSLAGRAVTLRLRGLSQGELCGHREDFVAAVVQRLTTIPAVSTDLTRTDYVSALAQGGFPEVASLPERLRRTWADGYLARALERDATRLPGGDQSRRIRSVVSLLAANQSGELVKARVAEQAAIPSSSLVAYLDAIDAIFLTDSLAPWTPNLTRREVGRRKVCGADSMLAMRLARTTPGQLVPLTSPTVGGFLEAFVVEELLKQRSWSEHDYDLYHWRDRAGHEVDVIVEFDDGRVLALEVKASSTYKADHFRGLTLLRDKLGDRFIAGIVLGMSSHGYQYADRLYGLPVASLWELT